MAGELWRRLCGKAIQPHTHTVYIFSACILDTAAKTEFVFCLQNLLRMRRHSHCVPFTCTLLTRVLLLLPACRTVKANMSPKDETWEKSDTGAGIKATPYCTVWNKNIVQHLKTGCLCFLLKTWHFLSTDSSNKSSSLGVKKWLWELSGSRK